MYYVDLRLGRGARIEHVYMDDLDSPPATSSNLCIFVRGGDNPCRGKRHTCWPGRRGRALSREGAHWRGRGGIFWALACRLMQISGVLWGCLQNCGTQRHTCLHYRTPLRSAVSIGPAPTLAPCRVMFAARKLRPSSASALTGRPHPFDATYCSALRPAAHVGNRSPVLASSAAPSTFKQHRTQSPPPTHGLHHLIRPGLAGRPHWPHPSLRTGRVLRPRARRFHERGENVRVGPVPSQAQEP